MRIENANELQQRLNTAGETLDELASARDKLYTQLDQIYSSSSYTESGRTEHENKLRSEYAAVKTAALNEFRNIISDVHSWDSTSTIRTAGMDSEFAAHVQIAASIGTTATKEVAEAVLMLGKSRIQVAALCSILADKCTDENAKKAIADKTYSPDTYYAEAAEKLNEYLSSDDFQLVNVAGLFKDMCYKISNAAVYVSFSTSTIKDADKSGAPYSTSTPVTVE